MMKDWNIVKVEGILKVEGLKKFIAENHYLGESMPKGCRHVFVLYSKKKIIGAAVYGIPAGRNCYSKYGHDIVELRRFVLKEGLPKNTGSWFMARCHKQLREYNILSYSDPAQGHTGTLYKAANFTHLGKQRQGSSRIMYKGKIMFAQGNKSKRIPINKKKIVYMAKKDIWFLKNNKG